MHNDDEFSKMTCHKGTKFGFTTGKTLRRNLTYRDMPSNWNDWTQMQINCNRLSKDERNQTLRNQVEELNQKV